MLRYCHYHAQVFIHQAQFISILETLCYHHSDINEQNQQSFISEEFKQLGFSVGFDGQGNINRLLLTHSPDADIDDLLVPIAPYVESGSFIELSVCPDSPGLSDSFTVHRWQFTGHGVSKQHFMVMQTPCSIVSRCHQKNKGNLSVAA
ncbi:hypothetical protein H0A36_26355 [Endozoicomonas sp. SM1973]|uniref:Uncharacterized protein n=1 Tax=Spartinivicinus marinus TaxID=2994442 RepID=A0A853I896_9GAMM|nr:hypothetical protein [Spartinivicinus marinus]MCX4030345.1 hypothetical protein [Spartinivicinus marinus]NYZ69543.1 hypothetical protein [Spartinivicinus marinus]